MVSNKVNPAVSLHKNATIFSVRSATRNPCQALVTAYRSCKAMLVSICTAYCENSLQCSSSFKKGVALKERLNRRRKRDREPSRIPVKRILNVLRKKKNRKKVQLFVRKTIPDSSFITCLSQNYKTWQLRYNSNNFYSKYACNMKVQKSTTRRKHCRYMTNAQSRENYFHCCHNKSSLKGGMHSNTAVTHDSPWNCLSQRLAHIGLIPHDVGGSGDCFFKSVSYQLYGNADRHVEIRMAGISHLHNHPELYIEIISDDSWENYIRQMSLPGTWCDHLIIQAVANALNCVIRIIDSNANSPQATIITRVVQQGTQQTIFIGYINHVHYVSTVTDTNNQNIYRLQCVKRKYVSEYNNDNDLHKKITKSKNQLSEGAAEKKQERLTKKRANSKKQLSRETAEKRQERLAKIRANNNKTIVSRNC